MKEALTLGGSCDKTRLSRKESLLLISLVAGARRFLVRVGLNPWDAKLKEAIVNYLRIALKLESWYHTTRGTECLDEVFDLVVREVARVGAASERGPHAQQLTPAFLDLSAEVAFQKTAGQDYVEAGTSEGTFSWTNLILCGLQRTGRGKTGH